MCLIRRLVELKMMPWHHYAREMKRRTRLVAVAAHSRNKTQIAQWLRTWAATKNSMWSYRNRGHAMLQHKRRLLVRFFWGIWFRMRLSGRVLETRQEQTVARFLRRLLCRQFALWRSSCASFKVSASSFSASSFVFALLC